MVCRSSRAAQLRKILKSEGGSLPNLLGQSVFSSNCAWGERQIFTFSDFPPTSEILPDGAVYSSAEGMFSVYHDLNDDGSILAIESSFLSLSRDQWEAEHPKTLLATLGRTPLPYSDHKLWWLLPLRYWGCSGGSGFYGQLPDRLSLPSRWVHFFYNREDD